MLTISGGSPIAVLYGAYHFAENLGVRFYLHGDVIPDERISLPLPALDETAQAAVRHPRHPAVPRLPRRPRLVEPGRLPGLRDATGQAEDEFPRAAHLSGRWPECRTAGLDRAAAGRERRRHGEVQLPVLLGQHARNGTWGYAAIEDLRLYLRRRAALPGRRLRAGRDARA